MAKNTRTAPRLTPAPTIATRAADPATVSAAVLLLPVAQGTGTRPVLLGAAKGLVDARTLERLGATGALGELTRLPSDGSVKAAVIATVGLGKVDGSPSTAALRKAAGAAARALAGSSTVAVALTDPQTTTDQVRAVAEGLVLGSYVFNEKRTEKSLEGKKKAVGTFTLLVPRGPLAEAARTGATTAAGVTLTRDLANLPALDLGPQDFVDVASTLAEEAGVGVTVMDDKALARGGFGGLTAVGMGSARGPRLLRLEWAPEGAVRTVALVGKGIVFDSGGLSLKPAASMETMKYDMGGAATVLATILTAAALDLPVRVVAWCALAENMPSGAALRPGDVITHYGGTTVEVLNTDAEGRLVLADALVRAAEEEPDLIVDVATLTGAALVALGRLTFAILGTEDARAELVAAAETADELAWELPLTTELRPGLDSDIADLRNIGGTEGGGTITAALFLREFVPEGIPWAHLDIAGPGWNPAAAAHHIPKGATGIPVRTLVRLLEDSALESVDEPGQ